MTRRLLGELMKKLLFIITILTIYMSTNADTITIKNETDFDLYAGIYYYQKNADLAGDVKLVPAHKEEKFERPGMKGVPILGPSRYLGFSINKDDLKKQLTSSAFHLIGNTTIGPEQGSTFYIVMEKGHFEGLNFLEWHARPLLQKLSGVVDALDDLTLGMIRRKYLSSHPEANNPVMVRQSTALPNDEIAYRQARKPIAKVALEKLLGMKLADNEVPEIGISGSGGGYRAMLGTAGAADAAESLINASMYFAGLSGSTWWLGPWMHSGLTPKNFAATIPPKITRDFVSAPSDVGNLAKSLLLRFAFKQPISPVNIYGRLLAVNILTGLKNGPFDIYLADQAQRVRNGQSVFPIYTAVATKLPYQWVEFTPFECGGDYFGGYIPISAFGAPFLNGKMEYFTPPFNLHYILAITGSAFAARLSQALGMFAGQIPIAPVRNALLSGAEELEIGKFRASAAKVFNWTYGMRPLPRAQQRLISVVDGGIAYNLPLEALLRRKVNVIIILDYSDAPPGSELKKAETDLRARGFVLPPINYGGIENKRASVFKDPRNPAAPVIIYIPLTKNSKYPQLDPKDCMKSWCGTFSLSYPLDKSQLLMGLGKQNMTDALPTIIQELRAYVLNKRKK